MIRAGCGRREGRAASVRHRSPASGEGLGGAFAEDGAVIGSEAAEVPEAPFEGDAFDGAGFWFRGDEAAADAMEPLVQQVGLGADVEEVAAEGFEAAAAESDRGTEVVGAEWLSEVGVDEVAGGAQFLEASAQAAVTCGTMCGASAAEGHGEGVDDFCFCEGEDACGVGVLSLTFCEGAQSGDQIVDLAERGRVRHEGGAPRKDGVGRLWKMGRKGSEEGVGGNGERHGAETGWGDGFEVSTRLVPAEHARSVRHAEVEDFRWFRAIAGIDEGEAVACGGAGHGKAWPEAGGVEGAVGEGDP